MAEDKSSFDLFGKAWNTAKIYNSSNTVKKYDAIVESDSLKTLGEFVRDPKKMVETKGIDFDEKSDDRLQKYNVVKITPTKKLGKVENLTDMYLITDEKGRDIGIYYPATDNGQVAKFILSERFTNENSDILKKFSGQRVILEQKINKEYKVDNIEDLTKKLSKGQSLSLTQEEAKREIREEYRKKGMSFGDEEEQEQNLTSEEALEKKEEQQVLSEIPMQYRDQAIKFARENNLKIKDILIIKNPESLMRNIDNDRLKITKDGGPVILLRTNHGGADSLGDDVYAAQAGKSFIHDEKEDDVLEPVTDIYKGEDEVPELSQTEFNKLSDQERIQILESELREQERQIIEARKLFEMAEIQRMQKEEQEKIDNLERKINDLENKKLEIEEQSKEYKFDNPEGALNAIDTQIEEIRENITTIKENLQKSIDSLLGRDYKEEAREEAKQRLAEAPKEEADDDAKIHEHKSLFGGPNNPHIQS